VHQLQAQEMSTKAETRIKMEQYMLKHQGPHTVAGLAKAMKCDEAEIRKRMQHLVCGLVAVNVSAGQRPTLYQHAKHHVQQAKDPNVVNRRDPVTNSVMPNGSPSYWQKHMARFNESPRSV
jgi:predicted ArsR family transcriptional regulator